MKLIVCLDDRKGILFLGRRLSWDSTVRSSILTVCGGAKLWMNAYSAGKFGAEENICIAEDFLERAGEQDYCFVEDADAIPFLPVRELTVYWWNRCYPSDRKFPLEQAVEGMQLHSRSEFAGSSHDTITLEVYCR